MSKQRKFNPRTSDKIILIAVAVLSVLIAVLSFMQRGGLALVRGSLMLYLPAIDAALLVGWGLYALARRIPREGTRRVVVILVFVVMFLLVSLGFSYLSLVSNVSIPQKYASFASPSGAHKLVLLRGLDLDEDRIEARRQARLAADPESGEENVAADYGFIYKAYPEAMLGLFYRIDADVEGEASIGYASAGTLMMEWPDEDTAHFFVKDPGPGDGGEVTLRFK